MYRNRFDADGQKCNDCIKNIACASVRMVAVVLACKESDVVFYVHRPTHVHHTFQTSVKQHRLRRDRPLSVENCMVSCLCDRRCGDVSVRHQRLSLTFICTVVSIVRVSVLIHHNAVTAKIRRLVDVHLTSYQRSYMYVPRIQKWKSCYRKISLIQNFMVMLIH